jgi:cell division protein ZapD
VPEQLIYEQPINERIRTFLRLEHLFSQFNQHLHHNSAWDTHSALKAIIDILGMVGRGDIKRETIKELERQNLNLQSFIEIPDINHGKLSILIDEQKQCIASLHEISGNIGQDLQRNELLNGIKQRLTVPGGLCDFDFPVYSHWLNQPYENRKIIMQDWFEPFLSLQQSIKLILKVIRESTDPIDASAESGFFQQNIDANQPCLLIRVLLSTEASIYPEISAGKHRFSIRFFKSSNPAQRAEQVIKDIRFKLACCIL